MRVPSFAFAMTVLLLFGGLVGCDATGGNAGDDPGEPPSDDTAAPAAPNGVEARSGDGSLEVRWQTGGGDVDGYLVYRDTSSIGDVSGRAPVTDGSIDQTTFTDDAVENGTTYHYRVTAVDGSDNESDPSREARATPFPSPPQPPEN